MGSALWALCRVPYLRICVCTINAIKRGMVPLRFDWIELPATALHPHPQDVVETTPALATRLVLTFIQSQLSGTFE